MKPKIKHLLMMAFSFLFFFGFTNFVSASDVIEYDTYVLKYDYADSSGDLHKNKSYVMNVDKDILAVEYVTYEFYVVNNDTNSLNYPFGTYSINNNSIVETSIRFEDTLSSGSNTSFVIKNYDVATIEEMMASLIDIEFYENMVDLINKYLNANLEFVYTTTGGVAVNGYPTMNSNYTYKYSYLNGQNNLKEGYYSLYGLPALLDEIEFSNVSLTRLSDMYTITDLDNKYNEGYQDGWNDGFLEGESSIDITSDNDTVINMYIKENEMLTKEEGEEKYDQGFNDGKQYVYNNLDIDVTIQDYILNNYYTKNEYELNFEKGVSAGKEYVYSNVESDSIIREYVNTEVVETITNKTEIQVVDGNTGSSHTQLMIKNYDVTYSDTGDFTINVYKGQDTHKLEVVEKPITDTKVIKQVDSELIVKIVIGAIAVIGVITILSLIFASSTTTKKKRR